MEVDKYFQENNLWDICNDAIFGPDTLSDPEFADRLIEHDVASQSEIDDLIYDDVWLPLDLSTVYDCDLEEWVDWDNVEFNDDEFENIVSQYIDMDADKYLVLGSGMGWRKLSGYREADSVQDAMERDYDNHVYLESSDFDRKILTYTESSHDAPMGASFTIIALTREEYDALTDDGYDDPDPDMVDKLLTQGHLDPEDFERHDEEDVDDEYGEW